MNREPLESPSVRCGEEVNSHRGLWAEAKERNTIDAFQRSFLAGYVASRPGVLAINIKANGLALTLANALADTPSSCAFYMAAAASDVAKPQYWAPMPPESRA